MGALAVSINYPSIVELSSLSFHKLLSLNEAFHSIQDDDRQAKQYVYADQKKRSLIRHESSKDQGNVHKSMTGVPDSCHSLAPAHPSIDIKLLAVVN